MGGSKSSHLLSQRTPFHPLPPPMKRIEEEELAFAEDGDMHMK
jgi:hypothetical protein